MELQKIEWNENLSVNVKEIDEQHQKLIDIINKLNEGLKRKNAVLLLDEILDELVAYTKYHFATEEKYFERFCYEKAHLHKKEHDFFINKVKKYIEDSKKGKKFTVISDMVKFLNTWLIHHIKGTDKQYSEFFNLHGLS